MRRIQGAERKGFTLIEMVVVLFILAVLAGLVVAIVAMLRRSAEMAGSAKNQADIANQIQLYFALQSRYPQGMDSLLLTGGGIYAAEPTGATTSTQTGGMSASTVDGMPALYTQLSPGTLANDSTGQWARSLQRSGFEYVFDHTAGAANANRSAITRRDVSTGSVNVAEVLAGQPIVGRIYPIGDGAGTPNSLPANARMIALGFGERNATLGKTGQNAPIFPGADGSYYARFICYFLVYASGERATLVGVSDCMGRVPDYTIGQFTESLPNGARQP